MGNVQKKKIAVSSTNLMKRCNDISMEISKEVKSNEKKVFSTEQ